MAVHIALNVWISGFKFAHSGQHRVQGLAMGVMVEGMHWGFGPLWREVQ